MFKFENPFQHKLVLKIKPSLRKILQRERDWVNGETITLNFQVNTLTSIPIHCRVVDTEDSIAWNYCPMFFSFTVNDTYEDHIR